MSHSKRSILFWFVLANLVLLLVAGCSDFWVNPALTSMTVAASNGVPNPSINVGQTVQMVATGTFNDGSRQTINAGFSISPLSVATITSTGLVTGVASGTATVTAASTGLTATATVTVCGTQAAITISPLNPTPPLSQGTFQFTATAGGQPVTNSVTWSSSDTTVATIDNSGTNGLAHLLKVGTTTITATSCSFSASTLLSVQ